MPFLAGRYLYGDYDSCMIWVLEENGAGGYLATELLDATLNISSYAEDQTGEFYVVNLGGTMGEKTASASALAAL